MLCMEGSIYPVSIKGKKLNLDVNFANYGAFLEYVSDVDELRRTIIKLHNKSN